MDICELYKTQIKNCDLITSSLYKNSPKYKELKKRYEGALHMSLSYETLQLLGLDVMLKENQYVFLNSRNRLIKDETFCIVDIESTDSISNGQIIEIGAVKLKNGKIIDTFERLIYAQEVPENIVELTGINTNMLKNAEKSSKVLSDFRLFLANHIFVAHNVNFDYGFIAKESLQFLSAPLLNQRLCTIMLSRRCIKADKYGLDNLKAKLGINSTHHRALSDALACTEILKYCIKHLPLYVKTGLDLIVFSQSKLQKQYNL